MHRLIQGEDSPFRVFLLEDNHGDVMIVRRLLSKNDFAHFDLEVADRVSKAREILAAGHDFDVILLDLNVVDSIGASTFSKVQSLQCQAPVIVFTGMNEKALGKTLMEKGAYAFLRKDELTESVLFNTIYSCIQRKLTENKLHRMKERAERANLDKTHFLSKMSHELRTPLSVILGFSGLVNEKGVDHYTAVSYLDRVHQNASHLLRLVNDLFDLSKLQSEHLEISKTQFSLFRFLDDVLDSSQLQTHGTNLVLKCSATGTLPQTVVSDETRLKQILTNIIGNAIKYSNQGTVELQVRSRGDLLEFDVSDQGAGMPEHAQNSLFQPYTRFDTSNKEGTGLGLAISQGLSRLLGGDLRLLRSTEAGSTFQVTIQSGDNEGVVYERYSWPHMPTVAVPGHEQRTELLSGRSILLIEDVEELQLLTKLHLEQNGATQIEVATTGEEAKLKMLQGDFDVILMDISLPDTNGLALTQHLRAAGYAKPIIALTAHALREWEEKCLDAGCSGYMSKPIDYLALAHKIHESTSVTH